MTTILFLIQPPTPPRYRAKQALVTGTKLATPPGGSKHFLSTATGKSRNIQGRYAGSLPPPKKRPAHNGAGRVN